MNISPGNLKLVNFLQGKVDGTSLGALKTTTDNGNNFKALFSQFASSKDVTTGTTTAAAAGENLSTDKVMTNLDKSNISLNLPLVLGELKQLVDKMNSGNQANISSDSKNIESEMTNLINQLLTSIKDMSNSTNTSKKQAISSDTAVAGTKDNSSSASTNDVLDKIALMLNMLKMSASQGLNSNDNTSTDKSSMEQLLPMLMLMLAKGDLSSTDSTGDTNLTDKTSLNNVLQLMLTNLNGMAGTSIATLGDSTDSGGTDNIGETPLSEPHNSNLMELLFSKLKDISTSASLTKKNESITQLTKLSDILTKMLGSAQKSGSVQDKTDLTKLQAMLKNIINQVKQSGSTTNAIDQTKLGQVLKDLKEKVDLLSNEQDKADFVKLCETLNNVINQIKQSGSTGDAIDKTKLSEVLEDIKQKVDSLSSKQDKANFAVPYETLDNMINQIKQSGNTSDAIDKTELSEVLKGIKEKVDLLGSQQDKTDLAKLSELLLNSTDENKDNSTKAEAGNSGLTEETLLKILQELNKEVSNKKDNSVDSKASQGAGAGTVPITDITASMTQKDKLQGVDQKIGDVNKLSTDQPNTTAEDIGNSLASIIEAVIGKLKTQEGKVTPDRLKQTYRELVGELQLSKLNENAVILQTTSQADPQLQKNVATAAPAAPSSTEQTLKNQLVNILVLLSSEGNASTTSNKKTDNLKKFTTILDAQVNKKLPEEESLIKAVKPASKGAENPDSIKTQAQGTKLSKEDKILRDTAKISDDDGKVTKVNNFISQISNKTDLKTDAPADKPLINRATFNQDIIKAVKYMNTNNLKELSVKIAPGEMGEITIKLTMDQGNMKANISANTKDTYNLLNSNLNDLTNQLGSSDIKIHSLDINIYQEDTTFFNQNNNQNQQQSNSKRSRNSNIENTDGITAIGTTEVNEDNNISALV